MFSWPHLAAGGVAAALSLLADGAVAWPIRACPTPLPAPGTRFAGVVNHVGDGDSLCVAGISVRLADFYAAELHDPGGEYAKGVLTRLALGRPADCRADHFSYDRVVASCRVAGRDLGDAMRAAGVPEGGNGYH